MLITHRVRLTRIVSGTWRSAAAVVLTCTLSFIVSETLLKEHFEFPALVPSLLGTALAFFIGFNNNQAYGRWWEGRIIWGGLVNESRTWARLCLTFLGAGALSRRLVRRHIAFIYALKDALRGSDLRVWAGYLDEPERALVAASHNRHNTLLLLQGREVQAAYAEKKIDGYQLLELERTLSNLTSEMGRAERIKSTVFPTTYSYYTHSFVFLFIISITAVLGNTIGPWAILFGWLIGYVFLTIQAIGSTLVDPFAPTPTGLALDQISRNIERNLLEMSGESELPPPVTPVNDEYVM